MSSHCYLKISKDKKKSKEINKGWLMIKLFIKMLQKGLSHPSARPCIDEDAKFEELTNTRATVTAQDVKEGHFPVFAVKGEEPKRFVVELCYLTDPAFLRLLEKAEEEYGFKQMGALAIPCRPEELKKILQDRRAKCANELGTFELRVMSSSKFC